MFRKYLFLLIFIGFGLQAQHTVKGTLINPGNQSWVILYRVNGFQQNYVAQVSIKEGRFTFNLDAKAQPGVYRLLYKSNKTDFLDFIYNKEDIELSFNPKDPSNTINFSKSNENNMFKKYANNIAVPQSKVDSLQLLYFQPADVTKNAKIRRDYTKYLKEVNTVQQRYETLSKDMLTYHFIKASKRYNATLPFKDPSHYLASIKAHFFDAIDFNSLQLLNSTLINDRINDYIFYVNVSQNPQTQNNLFKKSINTVFAKINNSTLKKDLTYNLIKRFSNKDNKTITEFLLSNYFDKLPAKDQDLAYKNRVLNEMKTVVNAKAPNITWQDFSGNHSLYELTGAKYYLIVFWSSTCSHCLHEIPILYTYIKDKKDVKVVAVGLESGPNPWNTEMNKYPNFIHVFGKNKWQNKFSKAYNIHATPTYIILDADKNIIDKPYGVEDVKKYFNKKNIH
ncbi:MAG: TlpA disulfide reductase family protein [Flavobacteriaceae bacterium]